MSPTTIIEQRRSEQRVRLRNRGFESCVVRCPSWADLGPLEWLFLRPARVSARQFVSEMLGACLVPAWRPGEVEALPESDRARLRLALVAACGREREWRKLHGSHLSTDERLMAVMVWRWRDYERFLARVRDRRRELAASATKDVEPAGAVRLPDASIAAQDLRSMALPTGFPDYSKLLNTFPDYYKLRLFPYGSPLLPRLPDPALTTALGLVRKLYADPSPLVVQRVGGPSSFIWSKAMRSALGVGEPAWVNTVRMMTDGLVGPQNLRVGLGDLGLASSVAASLKLTHLLGIQSPAAAVLRMPMMRFDIGETLRRYTGEPLRDFFEAMQEAGLVADRWECRALWYLLSQFGPYELRHLAPLSRTEVEAAVLYALEAVVADGVVVPALRAAVAQAPHLGKFHRIQLDHMLLQAAERSYVIASGSLYPALEGAFGEVGAAKAIITANRRLTVDPKKKVKFESMVKQLGLHEEFELFVVTAVFGEAGDPYRHGHGDPEEGVRRQVLFGIAALAGWLQEFAGFPALDVLVARMASSLPTAIDRVRPPVLQVGS